MLQGTVLAGIVKAQGKVSHPLVDVHPNEVVKEGKCVISPSSTLITKVSVPSVGRMVKDSKDIANQLHHIMVSRAGLTHPSVGGFFPIM